MKTAGKLLVIALAIFCLIGIAAPAQAAGCAANPASGPIGTVFTIACSGFTPGANTNVYAVEPDGRVSGLNIYGFFPTTVKANGQGVASFAFVTEVPGAFSVPPGDYTFVVQELVKDGGGRIALKDTLTVTVESRPMNYSGATLTATRVSNRVFTIAGSGFVPNEAVNIWVTQPPAQTCSGLGIDQLTLGALAGDGSSLWSAPGSVNANAQGNISFTITFRSSACLGQTHIITARALASGRAGTVEVMPLGDLAPFMGTGALSVSPTPVFAFGSRFVVRGALFPPNTGVSCWFTRPDGRVLFFISVDTRTNANGSFQVGASLDDFPPFTSTEPGWWSVTCATPNRSTQGTARFLVVALPDP